MNPWVLLIIMSTPSGDLVDKFSVETSSQEECVFLIKHLPHKSDARKFKLNAVCTTETTPYIKDWKK